MRRKQLFVLFDQARAAIGHTDYVVVGSLAVLGLDDEEAIPVGMTMSIDVDCYTRADPERIFELKETLGEGSAFHARNGYYLDPVSPKLPTLPEGWEGRMTQVRHEGLRLWFLDPNDTAVSKYARGDPRDVEWIRAGVQAGIVSLQGVKTRLRDTAFLDEDEALRVKRQVDKDAAWFDALRQQAPPGT